MQKCKSRKVENIVVEKKKKKNDFKTAFVNNINKQIIFYLFIFLIEKINQKDLHVIFVTPT